MNKIILLISSIVVLFIASCFLLPKILYPTLGPAKDDYGFWVEDHFLDEFGDREIGKTYWTNIDTIYATYNDYLGEREVKVIVNVQPDANIVWIELFKDKQGKISVLPNDHVEKKEYIIKMKRNGHEIVLDNNELKKYDKAVGLDEESSIKLINLFKKGGEFKFLINEYSIINNVSYSFTLNDIYGKGFLNRMRCFYSYSKKPGCNYWKDICRCEYKKYFWF